MRITVLSTDTIHHTYFVSELKKLYPDTSVVCETKTYSALFETSHSFEVDRDNYELDRWFGGVKTKISDVALTKNVNNINDYETLKFLSEINPEVLISFGVGKIHSEIINLYGGRLVNLHGGNPEEYRGLDSHLWAIYHNDFINLITVLHLVDSNLDTGDIVETSNIELFAGMDIKALRKINTEICLNITIKALSNYEKNNIFDSRPQLKIGRYYSFMPSVLKDSCVKNFLRYTKDLV